MKVFVLGHRGMLGHVVARFFAEQGLQVLTTPERYTGAPNDPLIRAAVDSSAEWIVNCIGKIKQKTAEPFDLFLGNSQLPVHLKSFLKPGQQLLQPSTDCVFSGRRGNYKTDDPRDAEDFYGLSKILGEVVAEKGKCQVIRTSIIGPELSTSSGLMGWFLSQEGPVNGFTNHFWNGISTLEWAKLAAAVIKGELTLESALVQVASADTMSKHDLLQLIAEIWPHRIGIRPTEATDRIDRTLQPDTMRSTIKTQLAELRGWY